MLESLAQEESPEKKKDDSRFSSLFKTQKPVEEEKNGLSEEDVGELTIEESKALSDLANHETKGRLSSHDALESRS